MIEYDGSEDRLRFIASCLQDKDISSYFEAFFIVRDGILREQRLKEFTTYESIMSAIVNYNFRTSPKLSAGLFETIRFNMKMKHIHVKDWDFLDPAALYRKRYQTRG